MIAPPVWAPLVAAAALAVNQRNNTIQEHSTYISTETFHHVKFRLDFTFPVLKIAKPGYKNFSIEIATVESKTLCQYHVFSFTTNGSAGDYINKHYDEFTSSDIWKVAEKEMIEMYINWVNFKYGVILDESRVKYTPKFSWEILVFKNKDQLKI